MNMTETYNGYWTERVNVSGADRAEAVTSTAQPVAVGN